IESLSAAFLTGLAEQGRTLLGGDVAVGLVHRPATATERTFLERYGRVSESVSMRAMAYAMRGNAAQERQLVELRAVDGSCPVLGAVSLSASGSLAHGLSCRAELCGAVAEETMLDRLHVGLGGIIRIGTQRFRVAAVLAREPDRIAGGFSLGPHI